MTPSEARESLITANDLSIIVHQRTSHKISLSEANDILDDMAEAMADEEEEEEVEDEDDDLDIDEEDVDPDPT